MRFPSSSKRSSHTDHNRGRRRTHLSVEELESRVQPANLAVTSAYLCDVDGNKITKAAIGSLVYVKAEFTAHDLPAGASHVLRYTLDGSPRTSAPLNWGAGIPGTSHWVGTLGNWLVKPGAHTVTVKLDATNTVFETKSVDNTKTFNFSPIAFQSGYVPGQKFITPIGGTPWVNWTIVNYADLDTGPADTDYMGKSRTYDGHDALDITLPGNQSSSRFISMEPGVPIYAAADGIVKKAHDGMFDRNQSGGGEPTVLNLDNGDGNGNYVVIDHGNGWVTWYDHMRKNSVAVSEGDYVKAGTVLGLVGSSGNSSDPHLHFAVDYNGDTVETYVSPGAYWVNPLPYAPTTDIIPKSHYKNVHTTEVAGMAKIPISRKTFPFGSETVSWSTQGISAIAGSDYTASSGTLNFAPLEITKFIFVPITDDDRHEFQETFRINLANDDGDAWSVTVRLIDNDAILNYNDGTDTLTVTGHTNLLNDIITLDVVGSKLQVKVNSETRSFPISSPAGPVTKMIVNAGDGTDTIHVLATPASVKTTLNGGAGTDTINIGEPGELFDAMFSLDRIKGEVTVNGGTGNNKLNLKDNSITGLGRFYTITDGFVSRSGVKYNYDLVQELNLTAGSGGDQFVVQSTDGNTPVKIEGGGATDTIVGPNTTDTWVITGTNKGTLDFSGAYFTNVERLVGGTGADTFSFVAGAAIPQVNGGGGDDTILGPNRSTSWALAAMNGGTASWLVGFGRFISFRKVNFSLVENLTGGTSTDAFRLADGKGVTGTLDGGGGAADLLSYEQYSTAVAANLGSGVATATGGIIRIENSTGGLAEDHLTGDDAANVLRGGPGGNDILVGGGGADTLWGLTGRDILIGGLGADKLDGAEGDDLLIDGTTDLDANAAALAALRTAWAQALNYNQRIQNLNNTLTPSTVHHDVSADVLTGGIERDWFWADNLDTTDAVASGPDKEQVN